MLWLEKQTMSRKTPVFRNRAEQVLAYLRERVEEGHWKERLPPERSLAQQLGVSRWTLRAALKELQAEGIVSERSQAGARLTKPATEQKHRVSVGIVLSNKTDMARQRILFMLERLRHYLEVQGAELAVHLVPYPRSGEVSAHFKRLLATQRHDCWVLVSPLVSMQMWCAEQRVPVMVLGVSADAAGLPSVSADFRAVCRHAAGLMISRGHRRLGMLLATPMKSEDVLSQRGFEEGVQASSCQVEVRFEKHDQTGAGVMRLLDRLLAMKDGPTAWLVCRQASFTRIYTNLLYRKVSIPEELSVLCRDSDDFFDDLLPCPTFYRVNRKHLIHQAARLALRVALGQAQPHEKVWLMPELIEGATLGEYHPVVTSPALSPGSPLSSTRQPA